MYHGSMISGEEAIGLRLRVERRKNGLTQEELAQEAGTNQAVIQKIENGKSLRPRVIMQIAEVLKVNPAWLQFGDPWAERTIPEHNPLK
jgi:transcriptional regulator with XRE-family HTH domain